MNDNNNKRKNLKTEVIQTENSAPSQKEKGRKLMNKAEKKQQFSITLEPETIQKLSSVDERNYRKLLGRYIDKNADTLVLELQKL